MRTTFGLLDSIFDQNQTIDSVELELILSEYTI